MRDPLIVPLVSEAWVVNKALLSKDPQHPDYMIRRWGLTYDSLRYYTSPMPAAFSNEAPVTAAMLGVYLHWTLPAGLRHAKQNKEGALQFPPLPNRWLIVRYYGDPSKKRLANAWIIESDFLPEEGQEYKGTSPYPHPGKAGETRIGRCVPLADWLEPSSTHRVLGPLTAVSSGDIHFLAYQHYNENIFSFHDKVADDKLIGSRDKLSYSITGWYSLSVQDPLAKWTPEHLFSEWISNYRWQIEDKDSKQGANRSIYQGRVLGVDWDLLGAPPLSPNLPEKNSLKIAVGANGAEALAALILSNYNDKISPPLFAAMRGLLHKLEESDGLEDIEQHSHQGEFGTGLGGISWTVVSDEAKDTDEASSILSLKSDQAEKLDKLNKKQFSLETQQRLLKRMQSDLYSLWWKRKHANVNNLRDKDPQKVIPKDSDLKVTQKKIQDQIMKQQEICKSTLKELTDLQAAVTQNIAPKKLKQRMRSPFWHPRDPVVLVQGLIGPEEELTAILSCRFSQQIVNQISVKNIQITPTIVKKIFPILCTDRLSAEIKHVLDLILIENYVLDPLNAAALATESLVNLTVLRDIITNFSPFYGLAPWVQPWSPLFVEWSVQWSSVPFENWKFCRDPQYSQVFELKTIPQNLKTQTLSGHNLITPEITFAFKGQLKQLLEQDPKLQFSHWESVIDEIKQWPMLSLTLGDFHDKLAQRDNSMNRIPDSKDKLSTFIENQCHSIPIPGPVPQDLIKPASFFQTVRHGQFYFTGLSVVDRFGQSVDMIEHDNQTMIMSMAPIISSTLKPDLTIQKRAPQRFIQLTPRIIQDARLDIDWVSASDVSKRLLLACQENPIAGWLLPNYLNRSIQVFTAVGEYLGELQETSYSNNPLVWVSSPLDEKNTYPNLAALGKDFPWLCKILQGLMPANSKTAYQELLLAFDRAFSSKVVPDSQHTYYLSAIIGKPIALARSRWRLELAEPAYRDQIWNQTLTSTMDPALDYSFPITLGNINLNKDGLVGFFKEDDFAHLCSMYGSDADSYIQPGNMTLRPQNPDVDEPIIITFLLDPTNQIHAYSDILPCQTLSLPAVFTKTALSRMTLNFRQGPLLTSRLPMSLSPLQTSISLLQPTIKGNWSWYDPVENTQGKIRWQPSSLTNVNKSAHFPVTPTIIIEGLLQLSRLELDSQLTIKKTVSSLSSPLKESKSMVMRTLSYLTLQEILCLFLVNKHCRASIKPELKKYTNHLKPLGILGASSVDTLLNPRFKKSNYSSFDEINFSPISS